jgi:hypothetical protein
MLLHLHPRLYSPFKKVELIDLEISPLDLQLVGGVDIATRRPYPNKRYAVGCRKQGKKAINGLLIETAKPLDEFLVVARWLIQASLEVTHCVHYRVLDHDFDAASESMLLWAASLQEGGRITEDRTPAWAKSATRVRGEPMMEVIAATSVDHARQDILDEVAGGWIISRCETFSIPTIDRERITKPEFGDRMPPLSAVFHERMPSRPAPKRGPPVLRDDDVPF